MISKGMNRNRLSTETPQARDKDIQERIERLLVAPSNYEIQTDGKVLIISSGVYRPATPSSLVFNIMIFLNVT